MAENWRAWVADRFGLGPIKETLLDRRVPKAPWYVGDGAALLLLLGVLVVTGATMALTYAPSPESAYASVRFITEYQRLGWLVRGLHYWSAGLMVVMVFWHLFRQILLGGYKFPREGTWLVGVALFFLVLAMGFTGYVLRWDERAVYAATVAFHMFGYVPLIGDDLVVLVQGGAEVGATTLTRMYAVHVIVVPLLLLALVGWHLYLVVIKGILAQAEREQPVRSVEEQERLYEEEAHSDETGEPFYPDATVNSGRLALAVFALVVGLAVAFGPGRLYPEANLVAPSMPAEEWWFWWYSGLIALVPGAVAPVLVVVLPILVFVVLVALPFVDRGPWRGVRKRPLAAVGVFATVIALLALTEMRWQSPWTGWPTGEAPPVPEGVVLTPLAEEGRRLFAVYGCNSCHAVAGHGPDVGPDLARLDQRRARDEMAAYVLQPPEGVPMPAYAGRISAPDLEAVTEFIHVAQTFPWEE